ncbi:hypothetical protein [Methanolobus chelungpuianus]|uniref:hypothetical protein n=1 Tax=Methanolobus chelungpuianus TaxID=502115 RepID=UPI00211532D0|nr:hypothetical protein [Methanolobus chelungpuianus]
MSGIGIVSCEYCDIVLKRQFVGSNMFYYCKRCGRITSAKEKSVIEADCSMVGACV